MNGLQKLLAAPSPRSTASVGADASPIANTAQGIVDEASSRIEQSTQQAGSSLGRVEAAANRSIDAALPREEKSGNPIFNFILVGGAVYAAYRFGLTQGQGRKFSFYDKKQPEPVARTLRSGMRADAPFSFEPGNYGYDDEAPTERIPSTRRYSR